MRQEKLNSDYHNPSSTKNRMSDHGAKPPLLAEGNLARPSSMPDLCEHDEHDSDDEEEASFGYPIGNDSDSEDEGDQINAAPAIRDRLSFRTVKIPKYKIQDLDPQ